MKEYVTAMRTILIKDARLLWAPMLLCAVLLLGRPWLPGEVGQLAATLSTTANLILIVAVLHLDAPASHRLDWLTRPIPPIALLAAKSAFLLAALLLPSMAGDLLHGLVAGVPPETMLPALARDHFMALAMVLPIMAVTALTTRLIGAALLGVGVATLAGVVMSAVLAFAGQTPNMADEQIVGPMIHSSAIIIMGGSALVLWLHYVPRRKRAARLAFGVTVLLALAVQIGHALHP